MNIEHRTLNIERPTSNNEFCQFKKNAEQNESALRNSIWLPSTGSGPEHVKGSSSQAAVRLF